MAQKRRFLDVWIVESDTVYREVPYEVVTDWVQQGRLLDDDMLRWSGQAEWFRLGSTPMFKAFMPQAEPDRANDQAEALEPVHVDFSWKRPRDEEDDDVDMIPLIDVSLVLLVFFMMTTTAVAASFYIKTPAAENGNVMSDNDLYWVGVDFKRAGDREDKHTLVYVVGKGGEVLGQGADAKKWEVPDTDADREGVLNKVVQTLADAASEEKRPLQVTIKADQDMPSGLVRDLTRKLEEMGARVEKKFIGVSEKGP
jgi:biopolymer transport protein ExbD